jgi:acetyl esterase/lipase
MALALSSLKSWSKDLLPWPVSNVRVLRDLPYGSKLNSNSHALDLYLPADFPRPLPLIVCIHGGGWVMGDKSMFPNFLLPNMGYAVASINYRLASEAPFPAQIDDCWSAIDWLIANHKLYGIDETRIGLWGGSAGGHLALLAGLGYRLERAPGCRGKIKAVCDWCGPTDLTTICQEYPASAAGTKTSMHRYIQQLIGADPKSRVDLLKAASPMTYLHASGPPCLIMHGNRDDVVPLTQSKRFSERLLAKGGLCKMIVVPGGKHDFYSYDLEKQVGQFFDKTVKFSSNNVGNKLSKH